MQMHFTDTDDRNYIIFLRNNYGGKSSGILDKLLACLNFHVAAIIGRATDFGYRLAMNASGSQFISIPIEITGKVDTTWRELMETRTKELKRFLESKHFANELSEQTELKSTLITFGVKAELLYTITSPFFTDEVQVRMRPFDVDPCRFTIHEKPNEYFVHEYYSNRNTSIIAIDLSVPFKELYLESDALHLYEHCMLINMLDGSGNRPELFKNVDVNGFTSNAGLCYLYAMIEGRDAEAADKVKRIATEMAKWYFESRTPEFWERNGNDVRKQIARTTSEVIDGAPWDVFRNRSQTRNSKLNTSIFRRWSNRPLNMLIVTNSQVSISKHIDDYSKQYPASKIAISRIPKVDYIPFAALDSTMRMASVKISKEEAAEALWKAFSDGDTKAGICGVDVLLLPFSYGDPAAFFECVPIQAMMNQSMPLNRRQQIIAALAVFGSPFDEMRIPDRALPIRNLK